MLLGPWSDQVAKGSGWLGLIVGFPPVRRFLQMKRGSEGDVIRGSTRLPRPMRWDLTVVGIGPTFLPPDQNREVRHRSPLAFVLSGGCVGQKVEEGFVEVSEDDRAGEAREGLDLPARRPRA